MPKFKKGDLVRARKGVPPGFGLVIEDNGLRRRGRLVKVFWMTGHWKGERAWESPDYLTKMEVEGA